MTNRAHKGKGATLRNLALGLLSVTALTAGIGGALGQETIKIGAMTSLSGSGAPLGKITETAWRLAIDEINAAGGIAGKQVELILADTQTDPTHAVSEARRLVENEKIAAMVGPITSQEVMPVTAVTTEANLVQISTAASPDISPQIAPYHFSNSPTGVNQMIPAIEYATGTLGYTKLALISDNGGMSKAAVNEIAAYMTTIGLEPVGVQEFPFRTEDMTPQLFSLRNSGAEAVLLLNSLGDDARKMLQNRDEIGWEVPVFGSLTTTNYAAGNVQVIGEEAFNGVNSVQFVGMTYCPSDPVGESAFAKFAARAAAAIPDLDKMGGAAGITPYYIEPFILKAAIEGAGSTDGKVLADWIVANAGNIDSMIGEFTASDTSHFLPSKNALVVVKTPYKQREDGLTERVDCQS
ncbi:MAG: ABC transporter substrate-binding protein [Devosia sp.]|nr:ABC transporter substrate-binding protein [Devosia sp.]